MLLPPSAMVPKLDAQLPPAVLLARMLLVTVSGPGSELELKMAPPLPLGALLPEKVLLVTVAVPLTSLPMAPPPVAALPALCAENVLLGTASVPPVPLPPPVEAPSPKKVAVATVAPAAVPPLFSMALGVPPAMVTLSSARTLPWFTANTPLMLPPLMVITPPPSMVVLAPLRPFVLVTVIVAAPPQAKVTVPLKLPPPGRQASSATSVQLALVPVPTTHAKADEVAPTTAKTSSARSSTNRGRTVVVFIACLRC